MRNNQFKYGSISFLTYDEQTSFKEIVSLFTTGKDQLLTSFSCENDIIERMYSRGYTSDGQKERAMKIRKYVVASLIKLCGRINDDGSIDLRGEDIIFSLMERYNEVPHVLNEQEKNELCKYEKLRGKGHYTSKPKIPSHDCVRNGKLVLEIHNYGKRGCYIGDTPKRKLEDRIPEIIYKFLGISEERRSTHADTLEIDLIKKEERRQAKLHEVEYYQEINKIEILLNEVRDYEIACKIREYAFYVQQRNTQNDKDEWITWAKAMADWYDPYINKRDSLLGIRDHSSDLIPQIE